MRKSFKINQLTGKIEFSKEELKELLDEVYNAGYNDCQNNNFIYNTPIRYDYNWWQYPQVTYDTVPKFIYTDVISGDCTFSNEGH